jgi:hypothetical protein
VVIFIKESVDLNNAKFNVNGDAKNVIIYGLYDDKNQTSCKVSMTNGTQSSFLFYGKKSDIAINGSTFSGSLIGSRVSIKNKSTVQFPDSMVKYKAQPVILTWEEM